MRWRSISNPARPQHGSLDRLQAADLPLHRSSAPRQRQCRPDRSETTHQPAGKPSQGRPLCRIQPPVQPVGLLATHHTAEPACQADAAVKRRRTRGQGIDEPLLRDVPPFGISDDRPRRSLLRGHRSRCRPSARPGRHRVSAATGAGPALDRPHLPAALLLDLAPWLGGVAAVLAPAPVEAPGVMVSRAGAVLLAPGQQLT